MRTATATVVPEIEGWELVRVLGTGGSAQVWEAVPVDGGEPAAVKLLPLADGTVPAAANAEAALLQGFDHPHLVGLRDVLPMRWPDTGRPGIALVLDLAEAGSLADLLRRRGRLAPGEVVTAVAPVALAVAHVHEQAFVHGDVTPANLLFSAEGVPLLADLGVAKVIGGYGEVRTTAAYADPVVAGGGRPSTASDVFMLAATAFHALTGAPPWPDPLPGVALARAARGDVEPLRRALVDVPPSLAQVVMDGLCREPHLRPSAAAFALDLGRAARPLAVDFDAGRAVNADGSELVRWTGTPPPTGERETIGVDELAPSGAVAVPVRRRHRRPRTSGDPRRRVLAAAGVSVVVAVVVVAGGVVFGGDDPPGPAVAAPVVAPPVGSSPPPVAAAATWTDVLAGLDRWRAAAYESADPQTLARVYASADLLAADRATLADQVPVGCSLQGATTSYTAVRPTSEVAPDRRPASITLAVTAALSPSVLTCPGRADVALAGVVPTALSITLTATTDGYRISSQQAG